MNPVTKWKLPFGVLQTLLFDRKGFVVGVFRHCVLWRVWKAEGSVARPLPWLISSYTLSCFGVGGSGETPELQFRVCQKADSDPVGLGWGPRACTSNRAPGMPI